VPPGIRDHVQDAVANDFASATQGVLYGMAIALGLCFLVAVRYPRTRHASEATMVVGQ
jgi:hypothetical protein